MTTRSKPSRRSPTKPRANAPTARRRSNGRHEPAPELGAAHIQGFIVGVVAGIVIGAAGMTWLIREDGPAVAGVVNGPADPATSADEQQRPRFDFYRLLPEEELAVDARRQTPAERSAQTTKYQNYILQAGSFRRPEDADRRKGELAFLGLESTVERSENDSGVWYRVYIGPFDSRSDMMRARSLAAQSDIDTLLMKRN